MPPVHSCPVPPLICHPVRSAAIGRKVGRVVLLVFGAPGSGKTSGCHSGSTPHYEDITGDDIKLGMTNCTRRSAIYDLDDVKSQDGKSHNLIFIDVPGLGSEIALHPILKQVKNELQGLNHLNLVLLFTTVDRFNPAQVKEIKASLEYFKILNIKREMIHLIVTKAEGFSDAKREQYLQDAFTHPGMAKITALFKTGMHGSRVKYERCHFMCFKHPSVGRPEPEAKKLDKKYYLESRTALIELAAKAQFSVPMGAALMTRLQRNSPWGKAKHDFSHWMMKKNAQRHGKSVD